MLALGVAVGAIFAPARATALPFLPAIIDVGTTVVGSFSYDLAENPVDAAPDTDRGEYTFSGPNNGMSVTVGGNVFSSRATFPNLLVRVTDSTTSIGGAADFIQILAPADEASFFPFLTGFSRQNPALDPRGNLLLNFRFPHTHLQNDTLPTSIDPLATQPHPLEQFGIFAQIEGISTQLPTSGIREWAFFFGVNPADITISLANNVLSGVFTGTITEVDDSSQIGPPVPEPGTLLLFGSGVIGMGAVARRRSRRK